TQTPGPVELPPRRPEFPGEASAGARDTVPLPMRPAPLPLYGDPSRVPPDRPPGAVDIVVPVAGAPEAFSRCLDSLVSHTDLARDRLIVVLDGPQPAATGGRIERLRREERPEGVLVLENPRRQGFVAAVNRGLAVSDRDVILLNSDTQVTAGWVRKLQAAAGSAPEIATVTPFSTSATVAISGKVQAAAWSL